jgi:hypothetical protein
MPPVHILSQINPMYTTESYFSKINFNITSNPCLIHCEWLFLSGFRTKILYAFLTCFRQPTRPAHLILLDLITLIISVYRVQIMENLIKQLSSPSGHFVPLKFIYSPKHPAFNYPQRTCALTSKYT